MCCSPVDQPARLEKHWSSFAKTMMQRTEGDDWKVIVIMTR